MKFNLKNRPKFEELEYSALTWEKVKETIEWFEGFEKELREKLSALEKIRRRYGSEIWEIPAKIELLKEILGDE